GRGRGEFGFEGIGVDGEAHETPRRFCGREEGLAVDVLGAVRGARHGAKELREGCDVGLAGRAARGRIHATLAGSSWEVSRWPIAQRQRVSRSMGIGTGKGRRIVSDQASRSVRASAKESCTSSPGRRRTDEGASPVQTTGIRYASATSASAMASVIVSRWTMASAAWEPRRRSRSLGRLSGGHGVAGWMSRLRSVTWSASTSSRRTSDPDAYTRRGISGDPLGRRRMPGDLAATHSGMARPFGATILLDVDLDDALARLEVETVLVRPHLLRVQQLHPVQKIHS